jgi:predicted dehydrogenase
VDQQPVRIGVVGGGLMGRELAGLVGRWPSLVDHPCRPEIVAVADPNPTARDWFATVPSVRTLTDDWRHLLDDDGIDVLYLAVPHQLHEELYLAVAAAGRDFLGEKPFGIDLSASRRIVAAVETSSAFVRVSSEMPFFPGAQRAVAYAASGALGEVVEVRSGFAHSSDVDRSKPSNWKRRAETCGEIGVMGDLGMHVAHVPVRLGWLPASVYAVLDDIVRTRPDPAGGPGATVPCDTWDNALLACRVAADEPQAYDGRRFPMLWETRRIAPGQMNTWEFEALGMDGGVRFSTARRRSRPLRRPRRRAGVGAGPARQRLGLAELRGAIFEFGFADALLQMWAAYLAERAGPSATASAARRRRRPLASHEVFDAACGRTPPEPPSAPSR